MIAKANGGHRSPYRSFWRFLMRHESFSTPKQPQVNILRGEPPLRHTAPAGPLLPRLRTIPLEPSAIA